MSVDVIASGRTSEEKVRNHKISECKKSSGVQGVEKPKYFVLARFDSEDISYEETLPNTFNDFEGLLNKILINLEETEYVFRNQAKEILDRDLTLLNWRTKLKNLERCLEERRKIHERIDESMQFVFKLGAQINNSLTGIEKDLADSPQLANGRRFTPERMSMYEKMLNLHVGQREMLHQVSDAVSSLNDRMDNNPSDPVEQFVRILSLHVETLKMIEANIKEMEEELGAVESLCEFCPSWKGSRVNEYHFIEKKFKRPQDVNLTSYP